MDKIEQTLQKQLIETRNERTPLENVIPLKAPFIMFIDPCGACNFRCNFCPCNKSDYNKEERHKLMTFEQFTKVIDDVAQFEEPVKVIYLYGFGEPLINKDLPRMARYLKDKNVCREIRLVTNGSLLNPEMNQKLVDSGIDLIRISVEALDSEAYEKLCDFKMDYDKFVDNISDLFKRSRGKLKIAAKIVNATLDTEEKVNRFFEIYKPITDFQFIEDIVDGWPEFEEMTSLKEAKVEANNWIWKREHYTKCSFSLVMMMVHANGSVCPCPNDWKMSLSYGNAFDESVVDLWNSKKLQEFRLQHLEKGRAEIAFCKHCICSGYDKIDDIAPVLVKRIREGKNIRN